MTDTPTFAAMRGAPALVHSADPLPSAQAELGRSLTPSLRELPAALSETPVNSVSVSRHAVMLWLVDSWSAVRRCRRQRYLQDQRIPMVRVRTIGLCLRIRRLGVRIPSGAPSFSGNAEGTDRDTPIS